MRILFLVAESHWTGRARAFALAARGLASRGHEVFFACDESSPAPTHLDGATVTMIPIKRSSMAGGGTLQLRSELRERGVDVVFVHTDAEHLTAGSALRLGGGRGAVIRRIPPFALAGNAMSGRFATRLAPSGLLFSTEADRRAAAASRHALPSELAPLGVDAAEYDAGTPVARGTLGVRPDARLIVCVHDGGDKRGVLTAMRTVSLLSPRHRELHLAIVGAPHMDELRMHGAALGINAMMTILGARDDELSVLRAADIGWIASEGDAAAFAAFDFMAMRIPVIAARTPLTEHYIPDGIAGVLLPPGDPPSTGARVATFLAKQAQHAAMGNAARAKLQREFTLATMIDGFERAAGAATGRSAQPA